MKTRLVSEHACKKSFVCNEIGDLELHSTSDCVVESLWMEVCSDKDKTVICGIYRHPSHNIKTFCSRFEMSLEIIRNHDIPCVIAGDFNIDLTK